MVLGSGLGFITERFAGAINTRLVAAVSDDPSIDDDARRRAALRQQVAEAGERAALIFAEAPGEVARFLSDQPIRTRSALSFG